MKVTNLVVITEDGTCGIVNPEKLQLVQTPNGILLGIPDEDGTSVFAITLFPATLTPLVSIEPEPVPVE